MGNTTEKLVLLALASENVDEAVSALKKARKMQPTGKLEFSADVSHADFLQERRAFQKEREQFEKERREYQRSILAGQEERANRSKWQGLGDYAVVLAKPAAAIVLTVAILGGAGYGAVNYGGAAFAADEIVERICDAVGPTPFIDCAA